MKKRPRKLTFSERSEQRLGVSIDLAVECIRQGQIVAFPTETYYGLAVDPQNETAVERLYNVKERPVDKPLLVLIDEVAQLSGLTRETPQKFTPLMERFWPGPLTLIFPAADDVNPIVTAGTGTIGVRISPHPVAAELVRKFGSAITATSANISGFPAARTAREVTAMFGNKIDYILDGGSTAAGLCSTIVGLQKDELHVIRQGQIDISSEQL